MKLLGGIALSLLIGATPTETTVSVAYAGSLVATMEGPFAAALSRERHVRFEGEGKGSSALAHLIAAGLRHPDVFMSADPALLDRVGLRPYTIFGSARIVIAYSPRSLYAARFRAAAAGRGSLWQLLNDARIKIGRTDPQLDPKGRRTILSMQLIADAAGLKAGASGVLARESMFPEEDLLVRVDSGELDAGFFYSIETTAKRLPVIELPGAAALEGKIRYAVTILPQAPHPDAARTFVDFLLHGNGKAILEAAGLHFLKEPQIVR